MAERIGRGDDERLYQPKIHSQRIRELYQLKQESGRPLTVLVDEALRRYTHNDLADTIGQLLEAHDGLCLDNAEERDLLLNALLHAILNPNV